MTPRDIQKKFWPFILLGGLGIAASIYFSSDDDSYRRVIEEEIRKEGLYKKEQGKQ